MSAVDNRSVDMTNKQRINKLERTAKAFELRKQGYSLREIAAHLGVSHETIRKDITEMSQQFIEESRDIHASMLALELSRLDDMQRSVWIMAKTGDVKAIETVIKIMERRAKMLGFDAAQTTRSVQLSITPEELQRMSDDELQAIIEQFQ